MSVQKDYLAVQIKMSNSPNEDIPHCSKMAKYFRLASDFSLPYIWPSQLTLPRTGCIFQGFLTFVATQQKKESKYVCIFEEPKSPYVFHISFGD